ncbi:MAG: hypothetical protein V4613_12850 [Bacteroidota bacterium]
MKKIITKIIFFLLISSFFFISCSKKGTNEIIDNSPDSLSYMSTVMDIHKAKPMANMKGYVNFTFTSSGYSGPWWKFNFSTTTVFKVLDSFYTDSAGNFSFTLDKEQLKDFYGAYLTFVVPEIYQTPVVMSKDFYKLIKGSIIPVDPWGYILVNFKNFGFTNTACDYCWVDVCNPADTSKIKQLVHWSYSTLPPQGYYAKMTPGQYLLKARYSCGSFTREELVPITLLGYDTIELKNYLHY